MNVRERILSALSHLEKIALSPMSNGDRRELAKIKSELMEALRTLGEKDERQISSSR